MIIKKFDKFLESKSNDITYGAILLKFRPSNWETIISKINKDDLSEGKKGLEEDPHVTLIYGLHSDEIGDNEIINFFNNIDPIELEVLRISNFEQEKFDVVKYEVKLTPQLSDIHNKLKNTFPCTLEFEYSPHITIAYTKPGLSKKYCKDFESPIILPSIDEVIYSKPNGEVIKIDLNFS